MRLIEIRKKYLNQNKFLGAVLMDFFYAFDCYLPMTCLLLKYMRTNFLMKA